MDTSTPIATKPQHADTKKKLAEAITLGMPEKGWLHNVGRATRECCTWKACISL